jgi:hypothetical protein
MDKFLSPCIYSVDKKQERITFHRGANFTMRLVFNDLERSTIGEKSVKV